MHLSHFGTVSVSFRFHFGSISAPNQVEPKALVLEPKLTGTYTAQKFRYQNKEVAVLSVFSVSDQHYIIPSIHCKSVYFIYLFIQCFSFSKNLNYTV